MSTDGLANHERSSASPGSERVLLNTDHNEKESRERPQPDGWLRLSGKMLSDSRPSGKMRMVCFTSWGKMLVMLKRPVLSILCK
eukprot:scaffold155162_cov26-Tisochrysis_lutea.AAC.2